MYEFEYWDDSLKKKLTNLENHFPPEVCQELPQFLQALREKGEVSKADFKLGGVSGISEISGNTFKLSVTLDSPNRKIKVIDITVKSLELLRDRFSLSDNWNDNEVLARIPQYDNPEKIIKALQFISQGIDESYDLGWQLGHRAKKEKDISRHGQYAKSTLEQLGLIARTRQSRKLKSEVTAKGKLIVEAPDEDTQKRLLIEAMLNYKPVWLIMGKVTEDGQKLTDQLVLETVFPPEDWEADTSSRRSQTLKNWVKWISKYTGIPIHLEENVLQLTIPMLYGQSEVE